LSIFRKFVEKIQVLLEFYKNNEYFTRKPVNTSGHISLSSSQNEKCYKQSCRKNLNTHFAFSNFVSKIVSFMR